MSPSEWTGAVGSFKAASVFDLTILPREILRLESAPEGYLMSDPEALHLLLYAAAENQDLNAGNRLKTEISKIVEKILKKSPDLFLDAAPKGFESSARMLRHLCDAASFFKVKEWDLAIHQLIERLDESYDSTLGAFVDKRSGSLAFAFQNALGAWAFLSAWPRFQDEGLKTKGLCALKFIQEKLYDPLLGLVSEFPPQNSSLKYGCLGDCAWTSLAFSEAYLQSGDKSYRDFADVLAKYIFQELWDRERGGFLSRPGSDSETPSQKSVLENAVAFEALWRLRYIKGNNAYFKWIELGLHRFLDEGASQISNLPLLRIQDMLLKGRIELEIVGSPHENAVQKMLGALAYCYAPRKIVSFVEPNDQDYILAHGLEAPSYPRLFGCVGLKRRADTAETNLDAVSSVLNAAWCR